MLYYAHCLAIKSINKVSSDLDSDILWLQNASNRLIKSKLVTVSQFVKLSLYNNEILHKDTNRLIKSKLSGCTIYIYESLFQTYTKV